MKSFLIWFIAFIITALTAYYQRATGPTYPKSGQIEFAQKTIGYKLLRSHGGTSDHQVKINADTSFTAILAWKRYKVDELYNKSEMELIDGEFVGTLPNQPPAGKLEYYVILKQGDSETSLPSDETIVIRFKGDVPIWVLIPHVIFMFGAMLLSTRTGLEFYSKEPRLKIYTLWTLGFLFIGGFILGPIVQKYAFDAYWTGFPFGTDLTDNKTAFAFIGWLVALWMYPKSKNPKYWAVAAAILLLAIYMIPHSVMGSELDYNKIEKNKVQIQKNIQ